MYGVEGCPGPPPHHRLLTKAAPPHFLPHPLLHQKPIKPGMLTAKELTGAPLISYVPKSRKLRARASEPLGRERLLLRQRHASDTSAQGDVPRPGGPVPTTYYLGQNLYQKLLADQQEAYLQDFYRNPAFSVYRHAIQQQQQQPGLRRDHPVSKSFDNLSDTFSVSSDESENFIPRIIRPRRRRRKEKRRGAAGASEAEEAACLGSEKQWLPTGLLSAESSYDSRSEGSGSSEEEVTVNSMPVRRKLAPALSVPAYTSYTGSDYSSMASSSDTPPSSSSDQLFDSDSAPSSSPPPTKPLLKQTKSTASCSYFRSPKVTQKGLSKAGSRGGVDGEVEGREGGHHRPRQLRKTHSWAFASSPPAGSEGGEFSLFSPGSSNDLLSGIRQNLSR